MHLRPLILACAAVLLVVPARAQTPVCGPPTGKLALVLPGGGAKGFAHLGVLRMLDSLGVVPDVVVGTSAGAIMGALWASGLDVDEIERDVKALGLDTLVGRYNAPTPPSLGNRRAILAWEGGTQGLVLRTSVVRERPLNALISALYARGNLIAAGDFDRLPVPFRAIAADLSTREQVVLAGGDLAQAVRASGAIPIVFRSVRLNGRDLVDGGIVDNVPIEAARNLGATRIIVSGLRDTSRFDVSEDDPLSIAGQLLAFVFEQPLPPMRPADVWLSSDVSGVNQLDFSPENIDRVIAAGYHAAAALRDAACLPRGRLRPRGTVPPLTGFLMPGTVKAELANVLWLTLGDFGGGTPDLPRFQSRLRSLAQVDRFQSVWLHPQRVAGDSVQLAAEAQPSSAAQLLAGLAFDRELGPRLWVGRVERLTRRNAEITSVLAVGQFQQDLQVSLRRSYDVMRSPWSPLIGGAITRTQVRDIREGREYPVIQTADWLAEAGIERRLARRAAGAFTIFARQWDEPVFAGSPTALGARLRLRSAAAAENLPRGVVEFEGTPRYWRAAVELRRGFTRRRFTVEGLFSTALGERLPLQSSAYLGGADIGFPGFRLQELRGAQAAMAALRVAHPVYGPFSLQGMVAGGALQQQPYGVFRDAHGYFGARGGVGLSTALGDWALEYGVNDRARGSLYLRFGDWF